jgi:hypothetical protein
VSFGRSSIRFAVLVPVATNQALSPTPVILHVVPPTSRIAETAFVEGSIRATSLPSLQPVTQTAVLATPIPPQGDIALGTTILATTAFVAGSPDYLPRVRYPTRDLTETGGDPLRAAAPGRPTWTSATTRFVCGSILECEVVGHA